MYAKQHAPSSTSYATFGLPIHDERGVIREDSPVHRLRAGLRVRTFRTFRSSTRQPSPISSAGRGILGPATDARAKWSPNTTLATIQGGDSEWWRRIGVSSPPSLLWPGCSVQAQTAHRAARLAARRSRRAASFAASRRVGTSSARAEVHLVRGLTAERGVGDAGVVLLDVEGDEAAHLRDRVELVQEEPTVFQHAPPGLDQRVSVPLKVKTAHDRS